MMKLLLLHGPGIINSRKQLNIIKQQFEQDAISIWEDKFNVQDLASDLLTPSLFITKRLVVIENPQADIDLEQLPNVEELTLVFWFEKELTPKSKIIAFFKSHQGEIKYFPEKQESSIFPFLDSLGNRDKTAFIELAKLKKQNIEFQYLITMVYYLLRNLINIPVNSPPFVRKKLESQKRNFSDLELVDLYRFILQIDFKFKSGLIDKDQSEYAMVKQFLK